jgi:excisionase family DNA binding protein
MDDHFLTLEQVAELLHVSTKTVFNMTRDGRLPARRLPGSRRYLYVRQEILDLLDQHRTETARKIETVEKADAQLSPPSSPPA